MAVIKLKFAYTPEAPAEAVKFAVAPDIHAEDFIYQYHLGMQEKPSKETRAQVTAYYFLDGDRSAKQLHDLIREYHPRASSSRLSVFEFASGYGCVSRHLHNLADQYDLVACDIHEQAVAFLGDSLGINAVLSHSDPRKFNTGAKYDIVFALSFFSHMPDRTFRGWIEALFATLADDGLLIFTTHGRIAHEDMAHPMLDPNGYWFSAVSEQKDIPTDEYGCMIATPFYVLDQIARCPRAALLHFHEGFWWGKQDLFVVRKVSVDFRPEPLQQPQRPVTIHQTDVQRLLDDLAGMRQSISWRLTAPLRALGRLIGR